MLKLNELLIKSFMKPISNPFINIKTEIVHRNPLELVANRKPPRIQTKSVFGILFRCRRFTIEDFLVL